MNTSKNNMDRLLDLKILWEDEPDKRPRILKVVQRIAKVSGNTLFCIECRKLVAHLPNSIAVGKGHIYSHDGANEYRMTKLCEFCFDVLMHDPEDYEQLGVYVAEAIEARG